MKLNGLRLTAALGAALLLTACGGSDDAGQTSAAPTSESAAAATSEAPAGTAEAGDGVAIVDSWVKATAGTDETTMTAVFGVITNNTDADRTIVSATTTASPRAELHEMATVDGAMVMREIEGGIAVPAGGSTTLEPGGLHVMVLDATEEIAPGDEIDVVLTLDDNSTLEFTALAKEFAGANEEYESDGGMDMGTGEMDHSGHDMSGTDEMDHSGHDMSGTETATS